MVQLELLLLVGLPLLMFLQVAARLSAATRTHRVRALNLVGVPATMISRAAGLEGAVVGALGAGAGIGMFALVNPTLASGGLLGFTWFPAATAPRIVPSLVLNLLVSLAAAWAASRTTSGLGKATPVRSSSPAVPSGVLRLLPLAAGMALLLFVVPLMSPKATEPKATLTVVGVLLASLSVVVVVRPLALALGAWILKKSSGVAVRLGVRRLQYEPDGGRTVVTAVISLILLAGISQSVLHALEVTAGFSRDRVVLDVEGASLTPPQRARVADLKLGTWIRGERAQASLGITGPGFVNVYRMPCSALARAVGDTQACTDGSSYVLQDADRRLPVTLPPGTALTGTGRPVVVPEQELVIRDLARSLLWPGSVLVAADSSAGYPWSSSSFFRFRETVARSEAVEAALLTIEPTVGLRIGGRDLTLLTVSQLHRGSVQLGLVLGLSLGLLALFIASVDRVLERRRAVAALVVVGVPLSTLRRAQILLILVPLVAGAVPAVFVSAVSAHRYLQLGEPGEGYYVTPLLWAVAMASAASFAAMATGLVVAGRKPTGPELRRE